MDTITQIQTVNLPDGRTAALIVPQLAQELAIVDINVLKRLAALLPSANLRSIKAELVDKLQQVTTIEQYVTVLKDEVSFHETVNMISSITPEELIHNEPEREMVAEAPRRAY